MLFVLPGLVLIGLVVLGVWALFFRATLRHDRAVRDARKRQADFERRLATPGEPLYCIACRKRFAGPLTSQGCPDCSVCAFVIPACSSDDPAVRQQSTADTVVTASNTVADPAPEILQQGKHTS